MIDLRLVAYTPNGDRLAQLPHPLSLDLGQPLNDLPSLRVSYSAHALGADVLTDPVEVAAELYDPATGGWIEQPDSRFLRLARSGDETDPTGARSYTMPGYGWQMRKIRLYPPTDPGDLVDGKRGFLSASAGTILATFVQEWHNRGGSTAFDIDFSTVADSAGQAWDKTVTIYYSPGIDLLGVLANLSEQGVCDWQLQGRTLRAFNTDTTLGRDLSTGPGAVELRLGRDVTDAPDQASLEDVVTDVYLQGEEGFSLELNNPTATSPWGRWEEYLTQGGVSDEGTARLLAGAALATGSTERVQITRALIFDAAEHLPWIDYRPGDHVRASGDRGEMASLRVRQITLSRGGDGHVTGNVVLNDRFVEAEIRRARRVGGIVNGAVASGGSGTTPAPEGPDARLPAAPEGLIVDTVAYLDSDGAARGQITATWGLVDTAVDGAAMEIGSYELYHRPNVVGAVWTRVTSVDDPTNTATYSGYDVGEEWAFKVRAVGAHNSLRGPFSDQYAVTIAADTQPPPVPSAPVLSTRLGVINVDWDGLGSAGEPMPRDYLHTVVQMRDGDTWVETWEGSDSVDGDPWAIERGTWVISDTEGAYGNTGDDWLLRDVGVVDQDVTMYVTPPTTGTNTISLWMRHNDAAGSGYVTSWDMDSTWTNPTVMRVRISGWERTVWTNGVEDFSEVLVPSQDHIVTTFALRYEGSGDARITRVHGPEGGAWVPLGVMEGGPDTLVVPGQPYDEPRHFRLQAIDRSGNTSAPSAEAQISTTPLVDTDIYPDTIKAGHIAANAITADSIRAGAIEAGHISADAIEADKIAAGAIDGKIITGALIRTSPSGERVEMNSSGLRVTNSAGSSLVRLGYGIDTGMAVRDPNNGSLVPLAAHIFGIESGQSEVYWTVHDDFSQGPWVYETIISSVTPTTSRYLAMMSYEYDMAQEWGELVVKAEFINGGVVETTGPRTEVYTDMGLNRGPISAMELVNVTPGQTYYVRIAAQATKPWSLRRRNVILVPM